MDPSAHNTPSLGTPDGRRAFFLHLLQDTGQPIESRATALDSFFLLTQREAYNTGWNDALRARGEPQDPGA